MVTTATHPSTIEYHITDDVKPEWLNVVRRLQSACHGNRGYAVLSIQILVDKDGTPLRWTEPGQKKIEPRRLAGDALLMLCEMD